MKIRCTVFWCKGSTPATIEKIRERFAIPHYTTLNGESPCELEEEDFKVLKECENRGFLKIIPRNWSKNGKEYIFITR